MQADQIAMSTGFKNNLIRAVLSIALFIFVYLILLLTGGLITMMTFYVGLGMMFLHLSWLTILLGIGIMGMGVLIFIFLIKFIFAKNKIDRSHLLEITAQDEPRLFTLLEDIVREVNTQFPKRVYLSSAVNASVFYDSSFWSMFLPVRKNLEIGLGLVNGVSEAELKAILAHEFGHFAQGSMKVGSYVYQVNQIIYNLLYDNESFNAWLNRWGGITFYFDIFVRLAIYIIWGMQWVLRKMYDLINLSYMGLSREMEFHADEVAAHYSGSEPMISGLSRLSFLDSVFGDVLRHYGNKIDAAIKTQNLYPQHHFVMQYLAKVYNYPLINGLPQVDALNNPYDKSKLVIKDQWASHPSTPDRIQALKALNLATRTEEPNAANQLFDQLSRWQTELTQLVFSKVDYPSAPQDEDLPSFEQAYTSDYEKGIFPTLYNNYYDRHNPVNWPLETLQQSVPEAPLPLQANELFDAAAIDLVYGKLSLENDLRWLEMIQKGEYAIKTFDYAGVKYQKKEVPDLIARLQPELAALDERIKQHDLRIFQYFRAKAQAAQQESALIEAYQNLIAYDESYDAKYQIWQQMQQGVQFIPEQTPFAEIISNLEALKVVEAAFKPMVQLMLTEPIYAAALDEAKIKHFESYCAQEWVYFIQPDYQDEALDVLYNSINGAEVVLRDTYFNLKQHLLQLQAQLEIANPRV